ncbi:MAG: hypothetical protein KKC21_02465, partial [Nitrospinae bacterium]|nr:hypothetical protein [Nitrospinota bacterium]
AWNLAYLGFYERTGLRLGDTWNATIAVPAAGQDGRADTAAGLVGAETDIGRGALLTSTLIANYYGLRDIGLEPPTTNVAASPWQYNYTDNNGAVHALRVAFKFNLAGNYNYMFIDNLPGELGIALDTMVDGEAGAAAGDFLAVNAADATLASWPIATTVGGARWRMQF